MSGRRPASAALSLALAGALGLTCTAPLAVADARLRPVRAVESTPAAGDPRPLLAYYYIWFTESSWERAKRDYPALGRYSSDDEQVLRAHVRAAKAAGITGFAVSWKSTEILDRRLATLIKVAESESFKLEIVYQGLDVERQPLPVERIAEDLDLFVERFADSPVFDLYAKPLVVWSGTWEFTPHEVEQVTRTRREKLLILGSERSVPGYRRLAGTVDGNAYYWSSVNPDTYPDYAGKLRDMGEAVHRDNGLWLAPVAPGFDARAIGGRTVVARHGDFTLRRQWAAAVASEPDALGLISWNEFTENSHVEPSRSHGDTALRAVADLRGATPPSPLSAVDSSDPAPGTHDASRVVSVLILVGGAGTLALLVRRRRQS